jgi:hypothetical protein
VVEATLKGYQKWIIIHGRMPQQDVCKCTPLVYIGINSSLGAATKGIGKHTGKLGPESHAEEF